MLHRRAFTLIELLVVVGIISVLAAIVVPVANKIRQSASQTVCLSNMRQITAACVLYASDNGDQLPYCNWAGAGPNDGGVYQFGWMFTGPTYRSTRFPNINFSGSHYPINGVMTGVIWPYLNTLSVYHCPLDQPEFYAGTNWLASYLCNGAQCGYGASGGGGVGMGATLHRIKLPGLSVMFWEAMEQSYQGQSLTGAVWNDGASYPTEEVLAARHFKGANVSCFDGHAEWWDPGTWQPNASTGGWSRLWCSPYSASGH